MVWAVVTCLVAAGGVSSTAAGAEDPAPAWEPPPPFRKGDLDAGRLPQRTYTSEELLSYIAYVHEKTRATLAAVAADEAACAGHGRTSADWLVSGFGHAMAHFGNLQTFLWQHRR